MNDDGKNILSGIKQIRSFFEQTGLLLRTIDDKMKKEGWEPVSNTVTAYTSQSIQNPRQWFPNYLFRFYINKNHTDKLLFASILLDDDIWGEYKTKIIEPYVTAGFFDFGRGKEVGDNYDYSMAAWYGYYGDLTTSKSISSFDDGIEESYKKDHKFESYRCFGIPLVEIRNPQDITLKIVQPLFEMVSSQVKNRT